MPRLHTGGKFTEGTLLKSIIKYFDIIVNINIGFVGLGLI